MFASRFEAGSLLAQKLLSEKLTEVVLLAIPRGGVAVAEAISQNFGWPLFLIVTKKLSSPQNEELAIGAVGEDARSAFFNQELIDQLGVDDDCLGQEIRLKTAEVKRRQRSLAVQDRPPLVGKKVVIVDDGAATGATMVAAIRQVKGGEGPDEVIVAVPVVADSALEMIKGEADRVIYLKKPKIFFSVSQFYQNFDQVSEGEVKRILSAQE
ncbi:MAG: phosphoribosyltransferase family protein [Candidatus Shapirobacteria bacterium]|nr:phosphoribosyltransferase family protein [Candidatus Shapirobacteria bacterium]